MALAQDRDMIARQYVNDFADVFDFVAPALLAGVERAGCIEGGIIRAHLETMAAFPDSLIARKRGQDEARQSADMARSVLAGQLRIDELDAWLRAEGNARNPGTTADLIAAGLFVLLRTGQLRRNELPWAG
jgi:triphosphoribosyl-dephospho-CoA synthase